MRKVAFVVLAIVALGIFIVGCGTNIAGVPSTVAVVDGEKISSAEYLGDLHRKMGKDALRSMIERKILIKWAEDEKVPVTDEQVNKQIESLKRDGVYEDQVEFMGEEGIKQELEALQARINIARKMFEDDITDDQINEMYENMKTRYVHGPRKRIALIINPDEEALKDAAKAIKDGTEFDAAAAQYTDQRFSGGRTIKVWLDESQTEGMPEELVKTAKATKNGEVSKVFKIAQPNQPVQYALLKVENTQDKLDLKLKDVKDEVVDTLVMQRAQSDPGFQEEFAERKNNAKIEVKVPEFEELVYQFKAAPAPMPAMMSNPTPAPEKPAAEKAPDAKKK